MNNKNYKDIDKNFLSAFPIYLSNPEIFFGSGEFYLFEKDDVFCALKLETKKIFKIATLVGVPFSKNINFDEKEFLNELISYLKINKFCDLLNPTLHFFMCTEAPKGSISADIGSLVVDLTVDKEEILKKFSSNYKNEIKKVQKQSWQIYKDQELDEYHSLYASVQNRQNLMVLPKSYFEKLENLENVKTYLWTIKVEDSLEGFVTIIQDNKNAYYLLGGAAHPSLFSGSNKLLQLELMLELKKNGVEKYNLGGYRKGNIENTKYKGIQNYKKRFGADIEDNKIFYVNINSSKAKMYSYLLKKYLKFKGVKTTENGLTYSYEQN